MKVNKVLKKRTNLTVISSFFILFAVIMSLIFIANSDIVKNDVQVENLDLYNAKLILDKYILKQQVYNDLYEL